MGSPTLSKALMGRNLKVNDVGQEESAVEMNFFAN